MNVSSALPHSALREALGQVIAHERAQWQRERELIEAQSREAIAELRARIVEIESGIKDAVAKRLESVRDGLDGAAGPQGEPGESGAAGLNGEQGEAGPQGVLGERGADGAAGADGSPGPQGDAGPIGPIGPAGPHGAPGAAGDVGPQGERGERGEAGERGPEGISGSIGPQGEAGAAGADGMAGAPGERGAAGKDGELGPIGPAGQTGATGERGAEGALGKLPLVMEWTDGVHYEVDVVSHRGSTYQALRDTGREPPHEDWQCIAVAGRDGADGQSFHVRGTWSEATVYQALDIVALNGASFVARRDEPGQCPGDGWQIIATQGKAGKPGERGVAGPRGERGEPGLPVVAADIDQEGLLTLTNGDGSTVRCDLYPLLTRIAR